MPGQQLPDGTIDDCNCASCRLIRGERRLRPQSPMEAALASMDTKPIPSRRSLINFTINGVQLEFWLDGVADVWVCKRGKYHDGRWKICGIVDGSFVRYPGLPLGIGIRITTEGKIVEVP